MNSTQLEPPPQRRAAATTERADTNTTKVQRVDASPRWRRAFLLTTALFIGVVMAVGWIWPQCQELLCTEDAALENLTVWAYAVAAVLAIAGLFRRADAVNPPRNKSIFALMLGLAVFGALEELSYGQRFFGLERPWVYHTRFDSAHDIVVIAIKIAIDLAKAWGWIFWVAAVILTGATSALVWRARHWILARMQTLLREPAFFFAIVFVALLVAATTVDAVLYFVREGGFRLPSQLLEELLETSASFALVWGSLLALRHAPVVKNPSP